MYLASFAADIKCVKVHGDYLLCTKIPEKNNILLWKRQGQGWILSWNRTGHTWYGPSWYSIHWCPKVGRFLFHSHQSDNNELNQLIWKTQDKGRKLNIF